MSHQDRSAAAAEIVRVHRCKECNRTFNSGKALGGHVSSAHIQPANKDYSSFKKLTVMKSKILDSGSGSGSGSGPVACGVCNKSFPSQKSLYGHMRCHPDREWRGMDPPLMTEDGTIILSSDSSDDSDSESDPGSEYLGPDPGCGPEDPNRPFDFVWPVTGRRGRQARPTLDSSWSSEDAAVTAGRQLLGILKKRKGDDHVDQEIKRPLVENPKPDELENIIKNGGEEEKGTFESEVEIFLGAISVLANGKSVDEEEHNSACKNKMKMKAAAYNDVVDDVAEQQLYVCSVCNKNFPTGQALGGHKKCHKNQKNIIVEKGSSSTKDTKDVTVRDFDLNMDPDEDACN